jgi:bifunctional UDP-N-acetylglucosamine pyrophosphorylase / glucosamine-1-phosphate N-acetyltransferase
MTDPAAQSTPLAAILLAAGQGTRMKSALPKVLHPVAGRPMINHVLDRLGELGCRPIVPVVAPGMAAVEQAARPWPVAVQAAPRGTGDAVRAAASRLEGFAGDVLIAYGDAPLIDGATLRRLVERRRAADRPDLALLAMRPADPAEYGRVILAADGSVAAIVEFRDAGPAERAVDLCNSGIMVVDGRRLFGWLAQIGNANAKGEFYLTDIVAIARREGARCAHEVGPASELLGINSRVELAAAEAVMQHRLRRAAMAGGATLVDPASVFLAADTTLGRDVTIAPWVHFGPGVTVADAVEIRAFCDIEGATIARGAVIGPFARLRPGSRIGEGARVGNFVETKNATLAAGAKANHLSYLGDAEVGAGSNIGAGTITCNYDGFDKARTVIGAGAFIGSNSALVAPVTVGDGAIVAAGSVVTADVAADALAIARAPQVDKPNWASRFRLWKRNPAAGRKPHGS